MGTRNLTCVFHDGKYKLAQYGQWDGYPGGQGVTVLDFLREKLPGNRDRFIQRLDACFKPTKEVLNQWYLDVGHDGSEWVDMDVADEFKKHHPSLSRDTGAVILALILESTEPVPITLTIDFAADSLFCEWLYVVDLDKNVLEVYTGFNKTPLTESDRFFFLMEKSHVERRKDDQYYPVKLIASFPFDNLPTTADFIQQCEPPEAEELSEDLPEKTAEEA